MTKKNEKKNIDRILFLRKKIDLIDKKIIKTLSLRGYLVDQIGFYKKTSGLPIRQKKRWRELMRARLLLAKKLNVNLDLVRSLFDEIQKDSIKRQLKVKVLKQKDMRKTKKEV